MFFAFSATFCRLLVKVPFSSLFVNEYSFEYFLSVAVWLKTKGIECVKHLHLLFPKFPSIEILKLKFHDIPENT